jgi:hypothetical protein
MTHFSQYKLGEVCLGDVSSNARTKSCAITDQGATIRVSLGRIHEPLGVPFHPSAFQDASAKRVSMTLACPPDMREWVLSVESAVLAKAQAEPEKFAKGLNTRSLQALFMSSVKEGPTGAQFRGKLNLEGNHACRFWQVDGTKTEMPPNMSGSSICVTVQPRQLWMTATACGVNWEITDVLLVNSGYPSKSPWADGD